jgi:hypothetical protein
MAEQDPAHPDLDVVGVGADAEGPFRRRAGGPAVRRS